ncbi:hypothetical protein VPH35_131725 [Triticum aestivum]|uniref:DUF4220 domain-containing protein n=1 Tax=Triticum turgidum subsp. durum TaxID=4567 RepID=A0A9R1A9I5_TRITD|nr:unnamed protein product [Triticum turgidum subsp. durum]
MHRSALSQISVKSWEGLQIFHRPIDRPARRYGRSRSMAGWLDQEGLDWTNAWLSRALVLLSFSTHLIVILCAGVRRHKSSGVRWFFLCVMFPLAEKASTYALSKLFLGSTSSEQQKLIAFWAPFLLLNLGRGDNICALYLQDNELSNREAVGATLEVVASIYGAYAHLGGDTSLLPAFLFMLVLGLWKYWERVKALQKGRMDTIRSTIEEVEGDQPVTIYPSLHLEWDNKKALESAHSLLHITKGAFTDKSFTLKEVEPNVNQPSWKGISAGEWNNFSKVVEMELSLMYDIMYTKSTMVHTWMGYFIRSISPIGTTTAFVLFSLHGRDGQSRVDIIMTYILLVTTFLLDMIWLLTALGSSWAYEAVKDTKKPLLMLKVHKICRFILYLDPSRLSLSRPHIRPIGSHRRWSGIIGQFNLLLDCTGEADENSTSWKLGELVVKKLASDEYWKEYRYCYLRGLNIPEPERDKLFKRIFEKLKSPFGKNKDNKKEKETLLPLQPACPPPMAPQFHCHHQHPCYPCPNPGYPCPAPDAYYNPGYLCPDAYYNPGYTGFPCFDAYYDPVYPADYIPWILHCYPLPVPETLMTERKEGVNIRRDRALDEHLGFDPELSEVILTWHIATDIFLQCSNKDDPLPKYKEVIKALSDYMMFLWVVRPAMLPGLLLRSHYEHTRKTLVGIWESEDCKNHCPEGGCVTEKHRLASFLLEKDKGAAESSSSSSSQSHSEESLFLSDGIQYAKVLLLLHREDTEMAGILKKVKMGKQLSKRLKKLMPELWSPKWSTRKKPSEELLSLIFDAWVRLLIFASKRCSRDSHAKQLGSGGELITIVWILIEHASLLHIDNTD